MREFLPSMFYTPEENNKRAEVWKRRIEESGWEPDLLPHSRMPLGAH